MDVFLEGVFFFWWFERGAKRKAINLEGDKKGDTPRGSACSFSSLLLWPGFLVSLFLVGLVVVLQRV